jgi:hypothetical protein
MAVMAIAASVYPWPSVYPTGTTLYDPDKAFNGYTLFTPIGSGGDAGTEPYEKPAPMYLIDMNGNVVHEWKLPFKSHHGVLLPDGNLLVNCRDEKQIEGRPGRKPYVLGGAQGWLYELDWDGNIVFQHFDPNMHHDFDKLPNGNYIYAAWEQVPKSLKKKVRGGIKGSEFDDGTMWNDYFVEINPQGKVVWEWHANDHFDPDRDIIGPVHSRKEWGHSNNVDVMKDGNVLVNFRVTDTMMIIDKATKEILWRWGAVAYLDKKTGQVEFNPMGKSHEASKNKTMGGPHDCNEIPPTYPGAGNILCYDNGMYLGTSRAVEVDPKTNEVVWESHAGSPRRGRRHFSSYISSAERLPNGNTFICAGANGRVFEVTPENEIVWEYISPHIGSSSSYYGVFRTHRYGPDHCPQLKDLPEAKGPAVVPPDVSTFKVTTK